MFCGSRLQSKCCWSQKQEIVNTGGWHSHEMTEPKCVTNKMSHALWNTDLLWGFVVLHQLSHEGYSTFSEQLMLSLAAWPLFDLCLSIIPPPLLLSLSILVFENMRRSVTCSFCPLKVLSFSKHKALICLNPPSTFSAGINKIIYRYADP